MKPIYPQQYNTYFKMVKNTTGGTGTKGLGRKHQTVNKHARLRISEDPLEIYGCVTKMLGNGMCEIHTNDDTKLLGHIRSKFRGRQKRHNIVSLLSIVLVGLRDFEKPAKNCDIMCIYSDLDIDQLKEMPNVKIDLLLRLRTNHFHSAGNDSNVDFSEAAGNNEGLNNKMVYEEDFVLDEGKEIDFDDI